MNDKIAIQHIHHVSFIVENVAVSLEFYCNLLGLEKKSTRPNMDFAGAWLKVNEQQEIHLLELNNPDPTRGRPAHGGRDRHAAFSVANLAPLKSRLKKQRIDYTLSRSGRAALFTRDPDGNALEFIETRAPS